MMFAIALKLRFLSKLLTFFFVLIQFNDTYSSFSSSNLILKHRFTVFKLKIVCRTCQVSNKSVDVLLVVASLSASVTLQQQKWIFFL